MVRMTGGTALPGKSLESEELWAQAGGMSHGVINIPIQAITLDGTTPPTATTTGTSAQSQVRVLQFDDTSSDDVYFGFVAPNDWYSGPYAEAYLEIPRRNGSNTTTTAVVYDATAKAYKLNGSVVHDVTTYTAITAVSTNLNATASRLERTRLNLSTFAQTVYPGDLVTIHLWRDHDASTGDEAGVADDATADDEVVQGVSVIYKRG